MGLESFQEIPMDLSFTAVGVVKEARLFAAVVVQMFSVRLVSEVV